jgi:hypothetical protein
MSKSATQTRQRAPDFGFSGCRLSSPVLQNFNGTRVYEVVPDYSIEVRQESDILAEKKD